MTVLEFLVKIQVLYVTVISGKLKQFKTEIVIKSCFNFPQNYFLANIFHLLQLSILIIALLRLLILLNFIKFQCADVF